MSNGRLYKNILKATNNLGDIRFTRYATVTKVKNNGLANVKEYDSTLVHENVPILNDIDLDKGDTVLVAFVNNNLHNPIILGSVEVE